MFKSVSDQIKLEASSRNGIVGKRLTFGVKFLDDALRGIRPDDLVLLGAMSGAGKTQLISIMAKANLALGKRVHLYALESSEFEIVQRIKYSLVAAAFYLDPSRPNIADFNFADWMDGKFEGQLNLYEELVDKHIEENYKNFNLFSKGEKFGVSELIESICYCQKETDLIIIDHAHYFDYDGDNENKSLKEIAKTVRTLSLDYRKPIILVAHLRKKDRHNDDLAPGMEEFHGSSDLFKIATKVITLAPGATTDRGNYETFFRLPKSRIDGSVTRYLGRTYFDRRTGLYTDDYKVGWALQKASKGFQELVPSDVPKWARLGCAGNGNDNNSISQVAKIIPNYANKAWQRPAYPVSRDD